MRLSRGSFSKLESPKSRDWKCAESESRGSASPPKPPACCEVEGEDADESIIQEKQMKGLNTVTLQEKLKTQHKKLKPLLSPLSH